MEVITWLFLWLKARDVIMHSVMAAGLLLWKVRREKGISDLDSNLILLQSTQKEILLEISSGLKEKYYKKKV